MTKNRARTPVNLDPGMHPGLEVKGLMRIKTNYLDTAMVINQSGSCLGYKAMSPCECMSAVSDPYP